MAKTPAKPPASKAAAAKIEKSTAPAKLPAPKAAAMKIEKPATLAPEKVAPAKAAKPATPAPAKAAKGKAPPPPPPAPEKARVITVKQMAAAYAEKHGMSPKDAASLLTEVFDTVVQHVKDGDKVRIAGLGILEVRSRAARMGRNPATGEAIQIAASRKIAFRAAKELKEAI